MKLSEEVVYQLEILWGVINLILSLMGLYFVYRWGVTLISTDDTVREILMGEPFATWFNKGDTAVLVVTSAYLGFKFVHILITTARWELSMEKARKSILAKRAAGQAQRISPRTP